MSNTTTDEPNKKAWADAATASATTQDGDPPPKRFREVLPCKLSDAERLKVGTEYADLVERRAEFEAQTKSLAQERKTGLAKIVDQEKKLRDAFRTGRVDREVEIVEQTSFRLGRRWKMRTDTMENYDEKPISAAERQTTLPVTQVSLPLDGRAAAAGEKPDDDENGEAPGSEDDSDITDPEQLLEDAATEYDDGDPF